MPDRPAVTPAWRQDPARSKATMLLSVLAERLGLAAVRNTLLVASSFAGWRSGCALDVGAWLTPMGAHTPGVIVSVAHFDDQERALLRAWRARPSTYGASGAAAPQRSRETP